MDKIKMSIELLDVICAVLDYRRFILSNQRIANKENFDCFTETESYFKTLPLPDGMKHNRDTFEKILSYEADTERLTRLNNTEYCDLGKEYF